jgi:hypothetical protein
MKILVIKYVQMDIKGEGLQFVQLSVNLTVNLTTILGKSLTVHLSLHLMLALQRHVRPYVAIFKLTLKHKWKPLTTCYIAYLCRKCYEIM